MPTNALLVRWGSGWRERTDTASIAAHGRHESLLSIGAVTRAPEADRVADAQLGLLSTPAKHISVDLAPTGAADQPYQAFGVGDTVTVPDVDGTPVRERVVGMTVAEDPSGYPTYAPDLRDLILDDRERFEQAIKKMDNGSLRGESRVAQPADPSTSTAGLYLPPFQPEIVFSLSGAVAISGSPAWVRQQNGVMSEVVAVLGAAGSTDTVIEIRKNGVAAHTITVPAGQTLQRDTGLVVAFVGNTDVLTDQVTAAGTGATDLTISHRFRF